MRSYTEFDKRSIMLAFLTIPFRVLLKRGLIQDIDWSYSTKNRGDSRNDRDCCPSYMPAS